ncbi:hypothetical protein WOLCODRAFT_27777, partial [Wolfiporia cocos MD-104 SS10]
MENDGDRLYGSAPCVTHACVREVAHHCIRALCYRACLWSAHAPETLEARVRHGACAR